MIQSIKHNFIYIGVTCNLNSRLEDHNNAQEKSTKSYIPFRLVYYKAFADKRDANDREKKLKQYGKSLGHLKRRLRFSLNNTVLVVR